MKLAGYLIEKYNKMDGAYTCHRLTDEAKALDIDLSIVGVNDCCLTEQGVENGGVLLEPRDFVINRYKWGRVKDAINHLARRSYNGIEPYNTFINKYEQIKLLRSEAFVIPDYVLSTSQFPYESLVRRLGVPFVAKGLENSMGREVRLIDNIDDYAALSADYTTSKEWLFEEFIAQSRGRDLRLFCLRNRAVACMMRKSGDDFRANVALGATVEAVEIDPTLQQIAQDVYEQTHLDFVGIDLLFGEDKYYLCEINVMPGLEGIEHASGINIAKEILTMIKTDFSR
ncbi:MAG: RimK family alpha-L-glutamate ligase [Muribaculaceae bacterium]